LLLSVSRKFGTKEDLFDVKN